MRYLIAYILSLIAFTAQAVPNIYYPVAMVKMLDENGDEIVQLDSPWPPTIWIVAPELDDYVNFDDSDVEDGYYPWFIKHDTPGEYEVRVMCQGYRQLTATVDFRFVDFKAEESNLAFYEFTLEPAAAGVITGMVVDNEGRWVNGVRVSAGVPRDYLTVPDSGRYRLEAPPGDYKLVVKHTRTFSFGLGGWVGEELRYDSLQITVEENALTRADFVVPPMRYASISGVAYDVSTDEPIADLPIHFEHDSLTIATDSSGYYSFNRLAAHTPHKLIAGEDSDYFRTCKRTMPRPDTVIVWDLITAHKDGPGGVVELSTKPLDPAPSVSTSGRITGRITDTHGRGLFMAEIHSSAAGVDSNFGQSTRRGSAQSLEGDYSIFFIEPGLYTLRFTHSSYHAVTVDSVSVTTGEQIEINVKMVEQSLYCLDVVY